MKEIKHYLASALTSEKFVNNFEHLNPSTKNSFTYILKGGPGTGKSTILKKISSYFAEKDFEVENFHCSSDFESLDGVRIVDKEIAIIDGTSPHTQDPILPSITDKIVNLGDCIGDSIIKHKDEIILLNKEKSLHIQNAYTLLQSGGYLYKMNNDILKNNCCTFTANTVNKLISQLNLYPLKNVATSRKLFFSYICEEKKTLLSQNNFNELKLNLDNVSNSRIMSELAEKLVSFGYDIITFYEILCPTEIECLYIPKANTIVTKNNIILSNNLFNSNKQMIDEILKNVSNCMQSAREKHKEIEKFYIECLDFEKLDKISINLQNLIEKSSKL